MPRHRARPKHLGMMNVFQFHQYGVNRRNMKKDQTEQYPAKNGIIG